MKHYKLLKEHDSHFDLEHEKQGAFVVAKYGLDDSMIKKIRSLGAAHYAEGTEDAFGVKPEDAESDEDTLSSLPVYNEYATSSSPFETPLATATAPKISTSVEQKPSTQLESSVAEETKQPALPGYLTSTQGMLEPKNMRQPQGQAPQADQVDAFGKAFEQMKAANAGIAAAQATAAEQAAKAQMQSESEMLRLKNDFEKQVKELNDQDQKLMQDVMSAKIDPDRIWNNTSTGNRVLAGISIILGGLSQGMTGARSNPAMDVINNAIDRDIDAQKANLQKKSNLLSYNLNKYGRLDAAMAATRMQLLSITQAQINKTAAMSQSSVALNSAKLANAQIDMQKAQLAQSIAGQQTMQNVLQSPGGIPPSMIMRLPENVRETLVMMPNGNFFPATSKADAERVKKNTENFAGIQKTVQDATTFMAEGRVLPGQDRKGTADFLDSALTIEIKNLSALGVLTKDDMKIIDNMKPDLKAQTFRNQDVAKAQALNNYINQKINVYYEKNIPNYKPTSITETPIMGK